MTEINLELLREWAGAVDVAEVRTYRLSRNGVDLRCEIHDHGATAGDQRYTVRASLWNDYANGNCFNGAPSAEVAIANVRWDAVG